MQASVDAAQDKMIEDMKVELTERIEALQKEMKKVKTLAGSAGVSFGPTLTS